MIIAFAMEEVFVGNFWYWLPKDCVFGTRVIFTKPFRYMWE